MKKLFPSLVLLSLLGVMLVPVAASAATACTVRHTFTIGSGANPYTCTAGVNCTISDTGATVGQDNPAGCSQCCLLDTIYTITDWVFLIVLGLAIIFILIAAFNFITAGGSPEKAATARQYLIYGAIGILVAVLARAIPAIVKSIVGIT